jgi:uncharacterized protein (TIGR03067 family)
MTSDRDSDSAAAVLTPPDLGRLQGRWESVEGRRPAEFHVEGHHFTFRFRDGDAYAGGLDVVIDEWPRTMVMWITEGPDRHRGKTALCIYELDGDRLRWCPSEPGADDPPADFPAVEDGRRLCIVFRRLTTSSDTNPTARSDES